MADRRGTKASRPWFLGRPLSSLVHLWHFVRLGRPLFLLGGFLFYGLGAATAVYAGAVIDWSHYLRGQLAVTLIQLMAHYANDYFDLAADRANRHSTPWSGGSRVLVAGQVKEPVALAAALVLAALALIVILTITLAHPTGPWAGFLLALALLLAWQYNAPPLRLHSSGWGELATAFIVTGLTPLAGYYLQAGGTHTAMRPSWLLLLVVLPLCCLQFNMLLAIEWPDAAGDAVVGKRTLVVRLGGATAARLYLMVLVATYAMLPFLVWAGLPPAVALAFLSGTPLAAWLAWRLARGDWARPSRWSRLAFGSIALLILTATAQLVTFLWLQE
jgi:1,4-dihydroxy-2-naphthoate polyprenyltransferase